VTVARSTIVVVLLLVATLAINLAVLLQVRTEHRRVNDVSDQVYAVCQRVADRGPRC
jgi:signal transduction histidine kinase